MIGHLAFYTGCFTTIGPVGSHTGLISEFMSRTSIWKMALFNQSLWNVNNWSIAERSCVKCWNKFEFQSRSTVSRGDSSEMVETVGIICQNALINVDVNTECSTYFSHCYNPALVVTATLMKPASIILTAEKSNSDIMWCHNMVKSTEL